MTLSIRIVRFLGSSVGAYRTSIVPGVVKENTYVLPLLD